MLEIGRVCVKLAGRDAGKTCVIVDVLENKFVMIDGQTRRRKCNIAHLEPTSKTVKISKGADHATVAAALKDLGVEARESKPKTAAAKPVSTKKADREKAKKDTAAKKEKKADKKADKKLAKKKESKKDDKKAESKPAEPAKK